MTELETMTADGMAIAYWARTEPDTWAVVCRAGNRTFADLNSRANQLVRALRRRGLVAGDGVALMCRNRPEFVEVWAACQRAGWRLTAINFHLTADESAYVLSDCEAKAFIADATLGETAAGAAAGANTATVRLAVAGELERFESYDDALTAEDSADIDDPSHGSWMLYTSGTTGRPKGVLRAKPITTDNLAGYRHGHVHLCTGPLYHAAPLTLSLATPIIHGVTIVVMDQWSPEETLRLIDEYGVTHTHLVPTMFHRLLALPAEVREKYDVSSLVYVLHGAAPCPVHVKQAMIQWWGEVIVEYYAATEGSGTAVRSKEWLEKPGTVGRSLFPDGVRVGDEDGHAVPPGTIGLVWLRSTVNDNPFQYFKDTTKTEKAYRGEWFTLGDLGYMDDDGYLFLTDRDANLVISGGVNIYPAEIDAVLLEHPAVGDVATIGVPNPEWGEEVKAVVELKDGVAPSAVLADELMMHCRARLASFKCPRSVDFVDRLPREDNGKVYKRRLRDQYRAAYEADPRSESPAAS